MRERERSRWVGNLRNLNLSQFVAIILEPVRALQESCLGYYQNPHIVRSRSCLRKTKFVIYCPASVARVYRPAYTRDIQSREPGIRRLLEVPETGVKKNDEKSRPDRRWELMKKRHGLGGAVEQSWDISTELRDRTK